MNNRIDESAMIANAQTGNKFDLNHKELDAFLKTFAELIIRECADLAFDEIFEYFGIEE